MSLLSLASCASPLSYLVSTFISGQPIIVNCGDRAVSAIRSLGAFLMGEGREYIQRHWVWAIPTYGPS